MLLNYQFALPSTMDKYLQLNKKVYLQPHRKPYYMAITLW